MAENSKREQIIEYWVDKLLSGETERTRRYKAIKRIRLNLADIKNFTGQQLPLLAIVAKLPKPVPHKRDRGGSDVFISDLEVEFISYAMDSENPDSTISDLADDLWVTLYGDRTSGSGSQALTIDLDVSPEMNVLVIDPYLAFKMVCTFKYYHTTGGI